MSYDGDGLGRVATTDQGQKPADPERAGTVNVDEIITAIRGANYVEFLDWEQRVQMFAPSDEKSKLMSAVAERRALENEKIGQSLLDQIQACDKPYKFDELAELARKAIKLKRVGNFAGDLLKAIAEKEALFQSQEVPFWIKSIIKIQNYADLIEMRKLLARPGQWDLLEDPDGVRVALEEKEQELNDTSYRLYLSLLESFANQPMDDELYGDLLRANSRRYAPRVDS